ncbi:unnamed protein product [Arabis nemorensis]|uniref:Uncharacterized protein n=1 Tax=Arabis nemorensis TaxID=586526 RepID=A0A565B0F0_9BRAS|nr:unnamed protein product [Arabis nemorensis]
MRSLLGKDSFYVCIKEYYNATYTTYHWFTLTENRLVSIPFPSQPDPDSKENEWRVVNGLKLNKYSAFELAEYNGKLLMFPHQENNGEIWCAMIKLDRSGVEITGKVEWFDCV